MFPQDFFYEGEHKGVHIHENFRNYGVLETVVVFVVPSVKVFVVPSVIQHKSRLTI